MASLQDTEFHSAKQDYNLHYLCQLSHVDICHQARRAIMTAMRNEIDNQGCSMASNSVGKLVELAKYLCDWPTLKQLQAQGMWQPQATDIFLADLQMGRFDKALCHVESALVDNPKDAVLVAAKQELARLDSSQSFAYGELRQGSVSLTPLNFNHVADFSWQYNNTSIADLCNLPLFTSAQHWLHWLQLCQQQKQQYLFAVMHQHFGFIGSVSLHVFDNLGFFYYWLGPDFQRKGLGPIAVNVLMRLGYKHLNMQCCYAKVFQRNTPSHRAIAKLGFERLPFSALPPSEDEVFYYRGDKKTQHEHYEKLAWLLQALDSGIRLSASF